MYAWLISSVYNVRIVDMVDEHILLLIKLKMVHNT